MTTQPIDTVDAVVDAQTVAGQPACESMDIRRVVKVMYDASSDLLCCANRMINQASMLQLQASAIEERLNNEARR